MLAAASLADAQLPDGQGKETIQKICSSCHDTDTVIGIRRTRIGWERSVEQMISRGAKGSDDDFATIIDYLVTNFGKINVNTAQAKDLETFLGLPEKEAQAIAAYREQNGKFKDFAQLKTVPNVNGEKLDENRSRVAFSDRE
jgi:competence ComEA-like helix-hairpin-helix protein